MPLWIFRAVVVLQNSGHDHKRRPITIGNYAPTSCVAFLCVEETRFHPVLNGAPMEKYENYFFIYR